MGAFLSSEKLCNFSQSDLSIPGLPLVDETRVAVRGVYPGRERGPPTPEGAGRLIVTLSRLVATLLLCSSRLFQS
jgi:hypothetical protein